MALTVGDIMNRKAVSAITEVELFTTQPYLHSQETYLKNLIVYFFNLF